MRRIDTRVWLAAGTLVAAIATYHSAIQRLGNGACTVGGGCTSIQYDVLGLSVPNLALLAFALVSAAVLALRG